MVQNKDLVMVQEIVTEIEMVQEIVTEIEMVQEIGIVKPTRKNKKGRIEIVSVQSVKNLATKTESDKS
jgi:phage anti-repressor protein